MPVIRPQLGWANPPSLRIAAMLLALGFFCAGASRANPVGEVAYSQGVEKFRAGQFESAVVFFQQALANGVRDGRLHYNLGVAHYRLKQYSQARPAFQRAARDPATRQLAWYNLGLVNWRLQRVQSARYWFKRVLEEGEDPQLKKLAKKAQRRFARSPEVLANKRLSGLASFGFGYDQNPLNQSQEVVGVNGGKVEGGGFLRNTGFYQLQLHKDRNSSEKVGISYLIEEFAGDSQSDFFVLDGHYRLHWRKRKHNAQLSLNTAVSQIGGSRAQHTGAMRLGYGYQTSYGQFSLQYKLSGYRGLKPVFESQDGHRHELGLGWYLSEKTWGLRLVTNYQENTRVSLSVSPRRREVIGGGYWRPNWRWKLDLENSWRDSQYPASVQRHERRWQQQLRIEYRMSAHWWLKGRARNVDNDGNSNNFSYRRKRLDLGIDYRF